MADHLAELDKSPAATPNAEVTRPVYEDAYREVIIISLTFLIHRLLTMC